MTPIQTPDKQKTVHWTPAQRKAIDYRGGDLLLSAAAGSGKTATLTERIVSLLTAPGSTAEISRMLCVTFTRAAAAELKERIGKALRDAIAREGSSPRLTRQLCDLSRAQITTIHSFCLSVLRPRFMELSLPAGFTVAEEADIRALSRRTMTDVISAFFEEGAPDFLALADTLAGARDESSLDGVLLSLAGKLSGHGMDGADLARMADELCRCPSFFSAPAGAGTRTRLYRFAAHYRACFAEICDEFSGDPVLSVKYLPTARENLALAEALYTAAEAGDYAACRAALLSYDPPPLGRVSAKDQTDTCAFFKNTRKKFDTEVSVFAGTCFILNEEQIADVTRQTADVARAAARVLTAYFTELAERKRERGVVDFSDLEILTARLLMTEDHRPTAAAVEVAAAYDYIFIDEYQDTNRAQDDIFTAISGSSRRFMVGDIKQSIYRFRGAEPEVFSAYRRRWAPLGDDPSPAESSGPAAASLFMRENFRCDETVVQFVNLVSRHMFRRGTIPFTADDELAFAKTVPEGYVPAPAEVVLCQKPKGKRAGDEPEEPIRTEPQYVADRIARMLARGEAVPGDIAILLRSPASTGAAFAEALQARGIPVSHGSAVSLYTRPEVLYVLSILRAIDNPGRDIDLAAAMRGPVFGFDLTDLVEIRRTLRTGSLWDAVRVTAGLLPADAEGTVLPDPERASRCLAFAGRLSALRADARGMRADTLLLRLYGELGLEEIVAADPDRDPDQTAAALRELYDTARRFENGRGGGLFPFLKAVEEAVEAEEKTAAEEGTPAVRILSIHHSKGLEFPVCFLACTDRRRNQQDTTDSLLFDPALGAVMRLPDPSGLVRCDTPQRQSLVSAMQDAAAEEEMRVLYVALTRARERLIVTASVPDPAELLAAVQYSPETPFFSEETVFTAPNYITWILNAVAEARLAGEDTSFVTLTAAAPADEVRADPALPEIPEASAALPAAQIDHAARQIREKLSFVYPYDHLAAVPAKLTVSRLYPGILDGEEEGEIPAPAGERNAPPAFLADTTGEDAAFAGTATHVFLQFTDFDRLANLGVNAERDRLLAGGFLTAEMAAAIRTDELQRFTESELFRRMRSAPFLKREFRFNAALPAADFTEDAALQTRLAEAGTDIIVQGVMDILFIDADGRAVLADYKTDRLTPAEIRDPALAAAKLLPRHERQLQYYRTVAAGMLGRPIDECLIYSLPLGDTVALQ